MNGVQREKGGSREKAMGDPFDKAPIANGVKIAPWRVVSSTYREACGAGCGGRT